MILDYNIEMERERLNKLLEKASTQEERIEIGNKLVELKILVPDSNCAKLSYRYVEIYNVFVGKDNF